MTIVHTDALTEIQKKAVLGLTEQCRAAEPITLSAPLEDGLDYYLAYEQSPEDGPLIGYAFLFYVPQEDEGSRPVYTCECGAFVHPQYRRRGCFSRLLNEALKNVEHFEQEHDCTVDFCFLTDERSPAASAVLTAIDAEYWYSEYKMVRSLRESDIGYISRVRIREEGSGLYSALLDGTIIGSCALLPSAREVCLYAFQIKEAYRSQGYGKDFLRGMLALLAGAAMNGDGREPAAPGTVSLQVSGLNYIARKLYKQTGFQETESVSYYIY